MGSSIGCDSFYSSYCDEDTVYGLGWGWYGGMGLQNSGAGSAGLGGSGDIWRR